MPNLIGEQVGGGASGRYVGANFQVTDAITNMGTRALTFLKIVATESDGSTAVNFSTSYTASTSDFGIAVRTIQQYAEIYAVGTPDSSGFIVIIADDTKNGANSGNTQSTGYGLLEAAIVSALANGGSSTATVTELAFDGIAIS